MKTTQKTDARSHRGTVLRQVVFFFFFFYILTLKDSCVSGPVCQHVELQYPFGTSALWCYRNELNHMHITVNGTDMGILVELRHNRFDVEQLH